MKFVKMIQEIGFKGEKYVRFIDTSTKNNGKKLDATSEDVQLSYHLNMDYLILERALIFDNKSRKKKIDMFYDRCVKEYQVRVENIASFVTERGL